MSKTLFDKIIAREIPAAIVYEDDLVLAIRDINPQAPTHVLIVPKKAIPRISEAKTADQQLLGHLLLKAAEVADKLGLTPSGYRLVINNGADGGETVEHLHIHILGGRHMAWPPSRLNSFLKYAITATTPMTMNFFSAMIPTHSPLSNPSFAAAASAPPATSVARP